MESNMTKPMLEIKPESATLSKIKPHLLPCRVHHNGSVEPTQSFWNPTESKDQEPIAYFRGRKLHGKRVQLPDGYRGVVVEQQEPAPDKQDIPPSSREVIDVDAEDEIEMGTLQTKGEFDEMVIWDHEATAEAGTDHYVRGVDEWLQLAGQIHSYEAPKSSG